MPDYQLHRFSPSPYSFWLLSSWENVIIDREWLILIVLGSCRDQISENLLWARFLTVIGFICSLFQRPSLSQEILIGYSENSEKLSRNNLPSRQAEMNEGERQRGRFLLSNEELLHLYDVSEDRDS